MTTLLKYVALDTPIHKLNPFTKTIIAITLLILLVIWMDVRYFIFLDIIIITLYLLARAPKSWLKLALSITILASLFTFFISFFICSPTLFKVYSKEFVTKTLFKLRVPYLGEIRYTYGSLLWTLAMANRFMALPVFFIYVYATSVSEIMDMLRKLKLPEGIIFSIAVTFKFIPQFIESFSTTITAQKLRGWDISTIKNPIKKAKRVAPILIPMLRSATTVAEEIALAAELRGFGATKPTPITEIKFRKRDFLVIIVSLAFLAIALYFNIMYNIGML